MASTSAPCAQKQVLADLPFANLSPVEDVCLYNYDAVLGMRAIPDASVDLAIVDPPYGAYSGGHYIIDASLKLPRFGGNWKIAAHDWDRKDLGAAIEETLGWLSELKRLVKPTGSFWVHATYHNGGIVNFLCQVLGIEIINEVVWFKRNAVPNLSARRLTASHETIYWLHTGGKKRLYRFNYQDVKARAYHGDNIKKAHRQLRTVWDIPNNKKADELHFGAHPTQKPLALTRRMFDVAGTVGGVALVPFAGSGTELIAAREYNMQAIGFETDYRYATMAAKRLKVQQPKLELN